MVRFPQEDWEDLESPLNLKSGGLTLPLPRADTELGDQP